MPDTTPQQIGNGERYVSRRTAMKHVDSLRQRLGLPPLKPEDEARLRRDVDEIVQAVVNENPRLRRWVDACRRVVGPKINCERDVFGNCDRCDRRLS